MSFSSNGKFGYILVDDSTYNVDTWYSLGQIGSGLACTGEISVSFAENTGVARVYIGILPNGGTPPTDLNTLGDLEIVEWNVPVLPGYPLVRNAFVMAAQETLYIYADANDTAFRFSGFVRSEV